MIDAQTVARPDYRAYALDRNGRSAEFVEVEADGDSDAVWLTRVLAEFYPIELWHGARLLGRFGLGDGDTLSEICARSAARPRPRATVR